MSKEVHSAGVPGADRCSDQATGQARPPKASSRVDHDACGALSPAHAGLLAERAIGALGDIAAKAAGLRGTLQSLHPLVEGGHCLLLGARLQAEAIGAMADQALHRCARPELVRFGGDVLAWRFMRKDDGPPAAAPAPLSLSQHGELLVEVARAASVLESTIALAVEPAGKLGDLVNAAAAAALAIGIRADDMLPELGRVVDQCGDAEMWLTRTHSSAKDIAELLGEGAP